MGKAIRCLIAMSSDEDFYTDSSDARQDISLGTVAKPNTRDDLQWHHLYPEHVKDCKVREYCVGKDIDADLELNAAVNFSRLTKDSNNVISNATPFTYFSSAQGKSNGMSNNFPALTSQLVGGVSFGYLMRLGNSKNPYADFQKFKEARANDIIIKVQAI